MHYWHKTSLITFFLCTVTSSLIAGELKVAGLFSSPNSDQYKCIVKGALADLKIKGLQITYKEFDYKNDVAQAAISAKQIIADGYDIVIGPRTSSEALVTAPLFEKAQIPQILPVASHPDVTKKRDYVVRMVSSSTAYSKLMARFIEEVLVAKKILVAFNLSSPYSVFYKEAIEQNMAAKVKPPQIEYFPIIDGTSDFRALVKKVQTENFDVVYAPNSGVQTVAIYAALAEKRVSTRLVTHAALFGAGNLLAKNARPETEIYFNGIWDKTIRGDEADVFRAAARKHCSKHQPSVRIATGFDVVRQLNAVLKTHPNMRGKKLVTAFKQVDHTGILGEWKIGEDGDPIRPLNIFIYRKDAFSHYKTINFNSVLAE